MVRCLLCQLFLLGVASCASCPEPPAEALLAACLAGELPPPQADGHRRLNTTARVVGVGPQLQQPCDPDWTLGDPEASAAEPLWLSLRPAAGASTWALGAWIDDLPNAPPSGRQRIWSLDVQVDDDGASYLEVRDDDGHAFVYLGVAPTVEALVHPEELIVEDGRAVCRDGCGQARTLEVEVIHDRRELRPYERLETSTNTMWSSWAHTVVHGGYVQGDCGEVSVAWWERPEN